MLKTFVFLATIWTPGAPVVFELDTGLTGADCVARMESGLTARDMAIIASETAVQGAATGAPISDSLELATAVLSCEFDWD